MLSELQPQITGYHKNGDDDLCNKQGHAVDGNEDDDRHHENSDHYNNNQDDAMMIT